MLYEARYEKLRGELVSARIRAGLTQSDLASRLGKAQSFVSKVETGERYLDVLDFLRWCEMSNADAGAMLRKIQRIAVSKVVR